jgi:glycosyltransferase involved in cell wall biosynthesis
VANVDYLSDVAPELAPKKVCLVHHGADLDVFRPASGQDKLSDPPLFLSVGRLVEKKGFTDLLCAYNQLKQLGYRFRGIISGDGPLRDELTALIQRLGLESEVTLAGACTQQELLPVLQQADIFALTPFVTGDGDRDGIPAVLVEAMACELPVVSTSVAGIPELVTHGYDGLLARPRDVMAITTALAALLDDPVKRQRLGLAARQTVVKRFDMRVGAQEMAALFNRAITRKHVFKPDLIAGRG